MFDEKSLELFDKARKLKEKYEELDKKIMIMQDKYNFITEPLEDELIKIEDEIKEVNARKINIINVLKEEEVSIPYLLALLISFISGIIALSLDKSFFMSSLSINLLNIGSSIFALAGSIGLVSFGKNIYNNIKTKKEKNKKDLLELTEKKNSILHKEIKLDDNFDIIYKEFMEVTNQYEEVIKQISEHYRSKNDNLYEEKINDINNNKEIVNPKIRMLKLSK